MKASRVTYAAPKGEERNRQAISIEQLLVWAYCDQMVHRARHDRDLGVRDSAPLASYSPLWDEGAPVESSRQSGFDAAPDAWRIHEEVLKLGKVTVDCGQDLAAARYHVLEQYRGAEPPLGNCATMDKQARPWPTDGLYEIDVRTLVMMHASRDSRPERRCIPEVRFKPGQVVRHPKSKGGVYSRGWFSHVQPVGVLPGEALQAYEVYRAWRSALEQLQVRFRSIRLTMFDVTRALPPGSQKPRLRA